MHRGTVKWFDPQKGFGFVVNESGEDVFVHYSSIKGEGFRCLRSGQEVRFQQINSEKGFMAKEVVLVAEPAQDVSDSVSQRPIQTEYQ